MQEFIIKSGNSDIRNITAQSFAVSHNYRKVKYHLIFLGWGGGGGWKPVNYIIYVFTCAFCYIETCRAYLSLDHTSKAVHMS